MKYPGKTYQLVQIRVRKFHPVEIPMWQLSH